jgi:uncharacterized oligopeptide transporter (OPT) family protein
MRTRSSDTLFGLMAGCAIGAVFAAANVYTGLKTAFIDGGAIPAAIVGFVLLRVIRGGGRPGSHVLNITQATAASAAVMVAVIGLAGPVPALAMSGETHPAWAWTAWGIAVGTLGVLLAWLLRAMLLEGESLPFPSGAAVARVIEAMDRSASDAGRRATTLLLLGTGAVVVTLLRDAWEIVPAMIAVPGTIAGLSAASLGIGLSSSPLVAATGVLVGRRGAWSMLLGGALAWVVGVPVLVRTGTIASAEFSEAGSWLMWPAVALMIAAVTTSFLAEAAGTRRALADLRRLWSQIRTRPSLSRLAWPLLAASGAVLVLGVVVLGLPVWVAVASLGLAVVFSVICARAAGETDIAPIGTAGAMTQIMLGSSSVGTSLVAASSTAGASSAAVQSLWALRATRLLGAARRPVAFGQLLGVVVGAVVAVPVYGLVVDAYGLGTEQMPAWGAVSWRATAEAVQGSASLPEGAALAAFVAAALGCTLALWSRRQETAWIPSPVAIAIGMMIPASFSVTVVVGAVLGQAVLRRRPGAPLDAAAAGAMAGESLTAIVLALYAAVA